MKQVLTKVAMEKCQMVLVSPAWKNEWEKLLDRLTVKMFSISTDEGKIFVSDQGLSLPEPRWGCVASLLDSSICSISSADLDPVCVKWLSGKSKRYGLNQLVHFVVLRPRLFQRFFLRRRNLPLSPS